MSILWKSKALPQAAATEGVEEMGGSVRNGRSVIRGSVLGFLIALAACAPQAPSLSQTGVLPPGGTILVRNVQGDIDAYAPERGRPAESYAIDVYGQGARPATIVRRSLVVDARATGPGVRFLVRGPKDGSMDLSTGKGSIMVADFEGVVNAHVGRGDIKMLIPRFGNASVGTGNLSVIFAQPDWPGTLHFSARNGNVELYVNEHARARIRMHTGNGTVYSDWPLKGTADGTSETIDGVINGGGPRSIDIEVGNGSIRVMQLKPQI